MCTTYCRDAHLYASASAEAAYTAVAVHRSHVSLSSHTGHVPPFSSIESYSYTAQYAAGQEARMTINTEPTFHTGVSLSSAFRRTLTEESMPCVSPTLFYPPGQSEPSVSNNNPAGHATYPNAQRFSSQETASQLSVDLLPYTRRNTPAPATDATPSIDAMRANNWQCPYCPYVQQSRRSPDLKRHIETHTRGKGVALWVCCGVPAVNGRELGVPAEVIRSAPIFDFEGVPMIGGCRKTFSRRDALARHLRMAKERGQCYGDPLSMHQPGNRLAMDEI